MTDKNKIDTEQGRLRLHKGNPNPNSAGDRELYLLSGDPTKGGIEEIIPDEGVVFPKPLAGLKENQDGAPSRDNVVFQVLFRKIFQTVFYLLWLTPDSSSRCTPEFRAAW